MLCFVLKSGATLDLGCGLPFIEGGKRRSLGSPGTSDSKFHFTQDSLRLARLVKSNAPEATVSSIFC